MYTKIVHIDQAYDAFQENQNENSYLMLLRQVRLKERKLTNYHGRPPDIVKIYERSLPFFVVTHSQQDCCASKVCYDKCNILFYCEVYFIIDVVSRLNVTVSLKPDQTTGIPLPSIDINLRGDELEKQRQTLSSVLDAINITARDRKITVGIALDEFQEVHKFGGETAEWNLRASIQQHGNIGYVLSGSREHLIQRMLSSNGALYKLVDKLPFGPINPRHIAEWIDKRMSESGCKAHGVGEHILRLTGARTRDIIQVARRCYDRTVSIGKASVEDAELAFEDIIAEEHDLLYACWYNFTAHQQNVLRAVAAAKRGLTTRDIRIHLPWGPVAQPLIQSRALLTLQRNFELTRSIYCVFAIYGIQYMVPYSLLFRCSVKAGHLIRQDPYTRKKLNTPTG